MDRRIKMSNLKEKWKKKRDKIQEGVERSSWTLSGMSRLNKVRVQLVIFAFLICLGSLAVLISGFFGSDIRVVSYSILTTLFFVTFIGKAFEFRKLYQINKLKEMMNQNGERTI